MKQNILFLHIFFCALLASTSVTHALPLDTIRLPAGFKISVFAEAVKGARSMAMSPSGTLFVGTRDTGRVYALRDDNRDGTAESIYVLAQGLNMPNGVAFKDGALYVAEVNRILRFDAIEENLASPGKPVVVYDSFPKERGHGWKFIRFGPDGYLYVPVGAPCNICEPGDPYAAIHRMKPDGTGIETFARGVRNSVGFDWHPETGELWFTDNGRDWLGDDVPSDELNRAGTQGLHFGFPYLHGKSVADPKYGKKPESLAIELPAFELGAHVASLGMRFYTGKMFPKQYRNRIFIAEHGSWNRSIPTGYRIVTIQLQGNTVVDQAVFAEGWLHNEKAWGRPVDVQETAAGALLISDDRADAIYLISYKGD